MKILILDNIFNRSYWYLSKTHTKLLEHYSKRKLIRFLKNLTKNQENNLKLKIISNRNYISHIGSKIEGSIDFELLSDYRIKLDRNEFLKIKRITNESTKKVIIQLFKNLIDLKFFHIKGLFIGKLIEYPLIIYFNIILGEYELLKRILKSEIYDKVIFINYNPNFLDLIKVLNLKSQNIEFYNDNILKNRRLSSKWFKFNFIIKQLIIDLSSNFFRILKRNKYKFFHNKKKTIIFYANTKNQYRSLNPIYNHLKNDININCLYYTPNILISKRKITGLIKFLFQMKRNWKKNKEKILENISIELKNVIEEFVNYEFIFKLIIDIFHKFHNFEYFIKNFPHHLFIISNIERATHRLYINICKINDIPTLFVPHAGIYKLFEISTKTDVDYFASPGMLTNNNMMERGVSKDNIIVTGIPKYEFFYKKKFEFLSEVRDLFTDKIYKFKKNKYTILLATSAFDNKSNEILLTTVINALKDLNLIENFIIKLHPSESGVIQKSVSKKLGVNIIIVRDYDLLKLINSSNLMLAPLSTAILEGMIIGTPVIAIDFINFSFFYTTEYDFFREEALIKVKNKDELTQTLRDLITNEDFYYKYSDNLKKVAKGYSYYDETKSSTERVVNLIYNIIKKNNHD